MPQQLDKKVRKFQQIRADEKAKAIAYNDMVKMSNGVVLTAFRFNGHTVDGDTLAMNVADWREQRELKPSSVEISELNALAKMQMKFPAIDDLNTALQVRRWQNAMKRREERQKIK